MDVEVRPVAADEIDAYLRVNPSAAGLPMWEPEAAAWHSGSGIGPRFAGSPSDEDLERLRAELLELDRTQAAFVQGRLVGTSAVLSLEVTVPGRGPVRMGGVTDVGVTATHRRRGVLTVMMRAMLDDCRDRGEALAGLGASEGGIYGRYGFGPATFQTRWELARSQAAYARPVDDPGGLELVGADEAKAAWPALHEAVRPARVGEVSPHPWFWERRTRADRGAAGEGHKQFVLHHDESGEVDGAAIFRQPWSPDAATAGTVQVEAMEASNDPAYAAVWAFLADLDLTRRVVTAHRPVDEPLRWLLADQRALRVTRTSDNLWIRLVHLPRALAERTYEMPGSLVLEVADAFCPWNEGRWRLDGGPDGATCERTDADPDLGIDAPTLGSVYLGGVALGPLARAGRITEATPGALGVATAMLTRSEAPHASVGF